MGLHTRPARHRRHGTGRPSASTSALLAISLVIAVLGVVNTLAMSAYERQREVGMLRAVGLDRRGVTPMIQLESVVISLFGAVIGIGLGSFLGWAVYAITKASIPEYALVLPWGRFGLFLLLAALVGLLAACGPPATRPG